MIVGRIINGFGMGVTSATCPVYQAECSKPRHRGKLVVVGSLSNTAAFCLSNWMNYGLYFQGSDTTQGGALQWRFPLGFQLVFPCFVAVALCLIPESPRWLLLKDRHDESLNVIARLQGKNASIHDPEVTAEFLSIQSALAAERKERVPLMDVFKCRDKTQTLRRLLLSCGTQFMQQFSGVNALGYYLPTLLQQSVGLSEQESRLMTGINGTIYFCKSLPRDTFLCVREDITDCVSNSLCHLLSVYHRPIWSSQVGRKEIAPRFQNLADNETQDDVVRFCHNGILLPGCSHVLEDCAE